MTRERDALRASYERLRLDVELMRRRITVAKAERVDTAQLELEFAKKLAELDALSAKLEPPAPAPPSREPKDKKKPTGRRPLRDADLLEERIELSDPGFEVQVAAGEAERIGFEESCKLAWQRGGLRRLVVARVKHRVPGPVPEAAVLATAPRPPETLRALWPRRRCSRASSSTSISTGCRCTGKRTASPAMACASTAARCAAGSRTWVQPVARR